MKSTPARPREPRLEPPLERLFSVRGKAALVTGGSRGVGYHIARGLIEAGARVYICSRHAEQCDAAARELARYGSCASVR